MASQLQSSINQVASVNAGLPAYDPNAIQAEYDRLQKEAQVKRREYLNRISQPTDSQHYLYTTQPFKYGKPIGLQGFKYLDTIKANDGDHYAQYQHVRGGDKYRYYNLVTEHWEQKTVERKWCNFCNNPYSAMTPGVNKCPNCGTEKEWHY